LAAVLSWFLPLNYLTSLLLFFGLPAGYLLLRKPKGIKRALAFALPLTSISILGDYFGAKDLSWYVPTIFPFRLFGVVALENVIWFFLTSLLIISYYELFLDRNSHKTLGRRMPILFLGLLSVITLLATLIYTHSAPAIPYFYFKSSIVLLCLPLLAFIFEFPRFIFVFLKMLPYFTALFFINEIVGLHKGYWSFPGRHFIGWFHIFGYSFPLEELFFYIILFCTAIITYFELFDDNRLKLRPIPLRIKR